MDARLFLSGLPSAGLPSAGLLAAGLLLALGLAFGPSAHAQEQPLPDTVRTAPPDSVRSDSLRSDSLRSDSLRSDSLRSDSLRSDSLRSDSLQARPRNRTGRRSRGGRSRAGGPASSSGDSLRTRGSSPGPGGGAGGASSKDAVVFAAEDSLIITFDQEAGDEGILYGRSSVSYEGATLRADTIEMAFDTETLRASGRIEPPGSGASAGGRTRTEPSDPESARNRSPQAQPAPQGRGRQPSSGGPPSSGSAATNGRPSFEQGSTAFTGDVLSYNIRTKRGRVVQARTQQEEGFVQGSAVKVYEDSTLYIRDGTYTTCDCPPDQTPSYSLRSNRMKMREQWVYTGPIQLYLFNIPAPLWLPFGILPATEGRRSGPLPPQYGEDQRGLFLRDWGWYFALNDYTDLQLRGSVWSQGSYEVRPLFRYRKRYLYNGQLEVTFQRDRRGEQFDPGFQNRYEGELRWRHRQTLSPTATFGGNVNLVTSSDFSRRNTESFDDAVRQEISSSVRYNKTWPDGGRSLNVSARQQQQLQSGQANLTFPSLTFSQNRFKPFERGTTAGGERWYEKITTQYDLSIENAYRFNPLDPERLRQRGDSTRADSLEAADIDWYEALVDRDTYQFATGDEDPFDFQATHRIPLQAAFRVNRFNVNLSPSINYRSDWYISTVRKQLQVDTTQAVDNGETTLAIDPEVVERSLPGFYARHDFTTSLSAGSELFGTFPVAAGPFRGLRHRVSPSLSFSYQPDFNTPFWGRTRSYVADTSGTVRRYDILTGNDVRSSTERRSVSFSLNNEFETKRVRTDTTGAENVQKIKLLDLDLRSSYNFAADSLKLSDITLNARTNLFDRFNITTSMTFSPYALERQGVDPLRLFQDPGEIRIVEVDRYMAAESPLTPARLTRFRTSINGSFRSSQRNGPPNPVSQPRARFTDALYAGQVGPDGGAAFTGIPDPYRFYPNTPTGYVDFSIPWSLRFDFNYSFQKPQQEIRNRRATLGTSFDFSVTPLWKVNGRTGYDLVQRELSTTTLSVFRDLGCWQLSFNWTPFGQFQSYSFSLNVKSGKLSQLLRLQIPQQGDDSRLGGFGDQLRGTVEGAAGGGGFGGSSRF